jgi:thiamine biosynthesis lipoprotein
MAIGPHPDQTPWQIGISHPRIPEASLMCVTIDRGAIATSGDYERYMDVNGIRYCHLLNPKTGWPSNTLHSVSVFADQCLVAGSLASIAMLKGEAGPNWLEANGVPHIWMNAQDVTHSSLTI